MNWSKALLAGLAGLLIGSAALADTWKFALIGDTPYSARERARLPALLEHIHQAGVAFVVHIGDFKNGSGPCDDAVFDDRYQLFNASPAPFVFVPGDNEWTDCHRLSNGGYDPEERLQALRQRFWATDRSLGRRQIKLERSSSAFPEQARFRLGPVLFVTLNLPGSDNNYGPGHQPSREYALRNPAVLAWMRENFALATHARLRGIVLLFQADPDFTHFTQGFPNRGYRDFLVALREEVASFPGQVVAVHGDTHISRIDQPLRNTNGHVLENFTRVETFGSPINGWTLGEINTDSPELFRFQPHSWP